MLSLYVQIVINLPMTLAVTAMIGNAIATTSKVHTKEGNRGRLFELPQHVFCTFAGSLFY